MAKPSITAASVVLIRYCTSKTLLNLCRPAITTIWIFWRSFGLRWDETHL